MFNVEPWEVAGAWDKMETPQWVTVHNVCLALPDECIVTEDKFTSTEATLAVILLARNGQ